MVNLPIPGLLEVETVSKNCFINCDFDYDKTISSEEFHRWLKQSFRISDFLLRFA